MSIITPRGPRHFGKQKPKFDHRTLHAARYMQNVPPAPSHCTYAPACKQPFGMMLNDNEGDCTCAGTGHGIQVLTANNGNEVTVPDSVIQQAYVTVTGEEGAAYNPATGANDNGCAMLDVLNYMRQQGMAGHKFGAYVQANPTWMGQVEQGIWLTGGIYIGLALPNYLQGLINDNAQIWTEPPAGADMSSAEYAPGGLGGHAVWGLGFTGNTITFVTWGEVIQMTKAFFKLYCDEAYYVLSPDWVSGAKPAPNGFNITQLQSDLTGL